ncbi:MAG: hypothetical protein U1F15_15425 [Burkholderiales bacterium]
MVELERDYPALRPPTLQPGRVKRPTIATVTRAAFVDLVLGMNPTHFVTLNFNMLYGSDQRRQALERWSRWVAGRLFSSSSFATALEDHFNFAAFLEWTSRGLPHFHLTARIDVRRHRWFHKCAQTLWRRVVGSGTLDCQSIAPSSDDVLRVALYATKGLEDPRSKGEYWLSGMLDIRR